MLLCPQIRRSVLHFIAQRSGFRCLHANLFTTAEDFIVSNEVLTLLDTANPMEDALEKIAPFLSSEIVNNVMQEQRRPELGFRFFIWTTRRRSFRSWVSRNLVMDMLAKDDGFDTYWKILEELKSSDIRIPSPTFSVLIAAYAKSGLAEKAVESFGRMKEFGCKPDIFTYNSILHVMVQKEVFLLALAVYNQMLKLNYCPNRATFLILIHGLCKNGKTGDALKMFDEMTQKGIPPNRKIYTIILSGLCQAKRTDDVNRLVNTMMESGCYPDSITCNALLDGFCKVGQIDEAFALLQLFEKEGYVLGLKGYSSLIDGLFRTKRYDEVQVWCRNMFKAGIEPDVVLYTILIRGFCQIGQVNHALDVLNEMTRRGLSPDTYCYNALIKGFCDIGLLDKARSLQLEISMNDCFPNSCTYTILICGMCRKGLLDEARQIFNQMENLGCSPSIMTFNALIDGLCKAGELEEARHLFYKMEIGKNPSLFLRLSQGADRVMDTASLQTMVERMCESGLILKAYKLLMQLADSGVVPDITTYNILINGFCKANNIDGAYKLFRELQIKGHSPDSVTYGTLIDGLHRVDREEDAFRVFDLMVKNGCTPSSAVYKSLMTWSCRKRNLSVAFSIWLKYLRSLPSWEDETLKLAEEHFEKGELEEVIRCLLEMDVKLNNLDIAPYTIWLIGLCQARRSDEAVKIFHALKEWQMDVTAPSCVMLINGLCKDGNLEMAVEIFLYTLEKGFILKPRICNQLLRYLISQDKRKTALELLNRMSSVGYELDEYLHHRIKSYLSSVWNEEEMEKNGYAPSSPVHKSLMTWSCRKGNLSVAFSLWLKYLRSLPSWEDDTLELAEEHFEKGKLEEAVRCLLEMNLKLNNLDIAPYTNWLIGLCQARMPGEALKIFHALKEWEMDVTAPSCAMLIIGLCKEGNLEMAVDIFLYTLEKGFMLKPRICNQLLGSLISQDKRKTALELVNRMSSAGYDLDKYVHHRIKSYLSSGWNEQELGNMAPG